MPVSGLAWGTIHPSALQHAATLLRPADATARPHGALRYQCPISGSFVLVTDETSLRQLTGKRARLRCTACGEIHLLSMDVDAGGPAIVATPADA
jgi:hypothetical protein